MLAEHAAEDSRDPEVDRMVAAAQAAQAEFQTWSEERVDALLKDIAETVAGRAEEPERPSSRRPTSGTPPTKR